MCKADSSIPLVSLRSLSREWNGLARDYRPSAFWFWNGPMERDGIQQTIEQMAQNDIREFLIHPIHGLEIEYLSEVYFERVEFALSLAKKYNLKVWFYDEYGWPSGNAGGKVIQKHPEYRGWFLQFCRDDDGCIKAEPVISDMVMDNAMGAPWTCNCKGQLDSLSPKAVSCFIEMTYQKTYERLRSFFGNTIVGFFTDEPVAMIPKPLTADGNFWNVPALPWTPELPDLFFQKYQYRIEPNYSRLAEPGFSQIKADYRKLTKDMHCDAYHLQISQWCREHGVKYTGHIGEDALLQQVRFSGSIFGSLSQMDEPGIDQLCYTPAPEDRFVQQVAVTSVTKHSGKARTFCEAWGISLLDLRLSTMFHQAEMLGIHGINDIALMGFHQNLDGVRKFTYWPPMFQTSPWWNWYGEFRDSFARAVSLSSLGKQHVRYAILYPQYELEQESIFTGMGDSNSLAGRLITELGLAIYQAGETFDFVFPEILDQAVALDGQIVFPNAKYDAIIAPSDLHFFQASQSALEKLKNSGGRVLNDKFDSIKSNILEADPSWKNQIEMSHNGNTGSLRIYQFDYSDGKMYALRNVSETTITVDLKTDSHFSEWDSLEGTCKITSNRITRQIDAKNTIWLSISNICSSGNPYETVEIPVLLNLEWKISEGTHNLAGLYDIEFGNSKDWVKAVAFTLPGDERACRRTGIPKQFRNMTEINFRGHFDAQTARINTGLAYESVHLKTLNVNGQNIDLKQSVVMPIWDCSCRWVDIGTLVIQGKNEVTGVLEFQSFETSVESEAFYGFWQPMPSCDIFLAGAFRVVDGQIQKHNGNAFKLPLDLSRQGWSQYYGAIRLEATVDLSEMQVGKLCAIKLAFFEEDAVEVLWDGISLGRRIAKPYRFNLPAQVSGIKHKIQIVLAGTTANLFCERVDWGIESVCLICKD